MKTKDEYSAELPFEVARRLLSTCEDVLLFGAVPPPTWVGRTFHRFRDVFDALLLNVHGASLMGGSLVSIIMMAIAIPMITLGLLQSVGFLSHKDAQGYTYAGWLFLSIAIAFSKPSRYALNGYTRKNAERVIERMPGLKLAAERSLSAIQDCLHRAEKETGARINTIKWTAGTSLAVAIYLAQKGFDLQNSELLGSAFVPLLIAAFIAGFIALHTRGATAVYGLAYAVVHSLEIEGEMRKELPTKRNRWLGQRRSKRRSDVM
jgi:hypothetical protein